MSKYQSASQVENLNKLQEEKARATALFLSIGEGAISADEQGRIAQVNDAALEILGYTREEIIGKWFPKIIVAIDESGRNIPLIDRPITKAFLSGKPIVEKLFYKTKTGECLPISTNVSPILLDGKPIGAVEVFRDISLEQEVDRMKSEFISVASHQLRTPLSAVNTYANMLAGGFKGELTPSQQELINIIVSSAERMNKLINTLLDISQLEAGKLNVAPQTVDLAAHAEGILQELKQQADAKNIDVKLELPTNDMIVLSDPLLLGEVFSNLITNAIKYTPKKGRVTVGLKESGHELVLYVKDNGYGIPANSKEQVFTKFFRGENIKKRETRGTGLGLYLVHQIANILGGRVWFKSKENEGSTFYFALPKQDN